MMFTETQLALVLCAVGGFVLGTFASSVVYALEKRRENRHIEQSLVWRNQGRGYRLVKQPTLNDETSKPRVP
jgi:hypothetical protein